MSLGDDKTSDQVKEGQERRKIKALPYEQDSFERDIIFTELQAIYDLPQTDEIQFMCRAKELQCLQRKFNKVQVKIEKRLMASGEFDKVEQLAIRSNFNEMYYGIQVAASQIKQAELNARRMSQSAHNSTVHDATCGAAAAPRKPRLPTLSLPTFSGEPTDWNSFFDQYKSIVHDSAHYENVERFRYLLTSLKDEPLQLVKSIPVTGENYQIALDILQARYENPRLIASKHLDRILDLESISNSDKGLRNALNIIVENLKALETLQFPIKSWDFMLVTLLLRKLNSNLRKRFEISLNSPTAIPTLEELFNFLNKELAANEIINFSKGSNPVSSTHKPGTSAKPNFQNNKQNQSQFHLCATAAAVSPTQKTFKCTLCQANHTLGKCSEFINMSVSERRNFIMNKNICMNCLCVGHLGKDCKSKFTCRTCNRKHHSLLHTIQTYNPSVKPPELTLGGFAVPEHAPPPPVAPTPALLASSTALPAASTPAPAPPLVDGAHAVTSLTGVTDATSPHTYSVLLSTALADIHLPDGNKHTVRCLIDTGAQATLISESCMDALRLPRKRLNTPLEGIGEHKTPTRGIVNLQLSPRYKAGPLLNVEAVILSKLTSYIPSVRLPIDRWPHLQYLLLADPEYDVPRPIDIIIGADLIPLIFIGNMITGQPDTPTAISTIFGYLLMGKVKLPVSSAIHTCHMSFADDIDTSLQKFWELESIPESHTLSPENAYCESLYADTVSRDSTGRYVVPLPIKPNAKQLGQSHNVALSRYKKLEYRLSKNVSLQNQYNKCLQEYVDLNHMEVLDEPTPADSYFIPHHCVVREGSVTTKVRVVFDGGCQTSNGISLNDILLKGPNLHQDIVEVLLKLRLHAIVLISDIKQMYRQILVREQDRNLQLILWRPSPTSPILTYRHRAVVFGLKSSPYLALRTIKQLAQDEMEHFPHAAQVLLNDVFVDDIVTGAVNESEALLLQRQLIDICKSGQFELRKWCSNCPALLASVLSDEMLDEQKRDHLVFADLDDSTAGVKVLGLMWNPKLDRFSFEIKYEPRENTKRTILSEIFRWYDPLGFIAPIVVLGKQLLQSLWLTKVGWDDVPRPEILQVWNTITSELPMLSTVTFPRHILPTNGSVQIHGFSDSSEKSMAACVYLRHCDSKGKINIYLLIAKTKVAPLKRISIPRLELSAAMLLAKLIELVLNTYQNFITIESVHAWTDSTIVLAWLSSESHEYKSFVSNRITEILTRLPANRWRHVPSADNPADAASRGMYPSEFIKHDLWFSGPHWLKSESTEWPQLTAIQRTDEERKKLIHTVAMSDELVDIEFIKKFSRLETLLRVVSYIFRFYRKCRKQGQSISHLISVHISVQEIKMSLNCLIKAVQRSAFKADLINIANNQVCTNQLRRLYPFVDSEGLMRVGGRLDKSCVPYEMKHQAILPKSHYLTCLIIDSTHVQYLHVGPQALQYILAQRFWILSARDAIRRRVHLCIKCFRAKPLAPQPVMAPLPSDRVRPARVFSKVGVDFCGFFHTRANKIRNAKIYKAYVAIFVCMSTKCIHMELVSDLSTESFIAALRRFASRRGLPTDIFSDMGSNFQGTNTYLKDLYSFLNDKTHQLTLAEHAVSEGITWHFNPASASHFGGIWEAGVKSFKHHLHRVVGTHVLTYDEFHTLICQSEAILNSRPLCLLSNDPEPLPLSPAHFLVGSPLTVPPDVDLVDTNPSRLTRWRLVQQFTQRLWKRWSAEYLNQLQQRGKWFKTRDTLAPVREGSVVLVREDNLPPLQWRLARVEALHPGSDGITRAVTLRMGDRSVKRPIVKVCPLPIE